MELMLPTKMPTALQVTQEFCLTLADTHQRLRWQSFQLKNLEKYLFCVHYLLPRMRKKLQNAGDIIVHIQRKMFLGFCRNLWQKEHAAWKIFVRFLMKPLTIHIYWIN